MIFRRKTADQIKKERQDWFEMKKRAAAKMSKKKALRKDDMAQYYGHWMEYSPWFCENCNQPIGSFERQACQAHILPKRPNGGFPSVAGEIENHMTLGTVNCNCHGKYDTGWETASKMPVFQLAKERLMTFIDKLTLEERNRVPEEFFTIL